MVSRAGGWSAESCLEESECFSAEGGQRFEDLRVGKELGPVGHCCGRLRCLEELPAEPREFSALQQKVINVFHLLAQVAIGGVYCFEAVQITVERAVARSDLGHQRSVGSGELAECLVRLGWVEHAEETGEFFLRRWSAGGQL